MAKRLTKPLPLPRSWLTFSHPEDRLTDREVILAGKSLNPGTKAFLRSLLQNAGWNPEAVEPVISGKYAVRNHLVDLLHGKDVDFNEAMLRFKEKGYAAEVLEKENGASTHALEVWDSLTRFPWWTAALRGQRTLAIVAKTPTAVQRASACFVRDLWANLGEAPEYRLPSVQRVNLLGFTSADGVNAFRQNIADKTGLVVATGLETPDLIYQMFSYAAALSQVAPHAMLVYEVVPSPEVSPETVLTAAQRAGFSTVFGVRRG